MAQRPVAPSITWRSRSACPLCRAYSSTRCCHIHRTDTVSLRWLYSHMIEEYARHNGHADLIRQAIDGATGE